MKRAIRTILKGFHKFVWRTQKEWLNIVKFLNKKFNGEKIYNYREL